MFGSVKKWKYKVYGCIFLFKKRKSWKNIFLSWLFVIYEGKLHLYENQATRMHYYTAEIPHETNVRVPVTPVNLHISCKNDKLGWDMSQIMIGIWHWHRAECVLCGLQNLNLTAASSVNMENGHEESRSLLGRTSHHNRLQIQTILVTQTRMKRRKRSQ